MEESISIINKKNGRIKPPFLLVAVIVYLLLPADMLYPSTASIAVTTATDNKITVSDVLLPPTSVLNVKFAKSLIVLNCVRILDQSAPAKAPKIVSPIKRAISIPGADVKVHFLAMLIAPQCVVLSIEKFIYVWLLIGYLW